MKYYELILKNIIYNHIHYKGLCERLDEPHELARRKENNCGHQHKCYNWHDLII